MPVNIPVGFASAAWVFEGSAGTQPYVFTMGLDVSDVGGDYVNVANQCHGAWQSALDELTSEEITLTRVVLSVGQDGGGVPSVDSSVAPAPGTRSGANEPIALALLVNKTTGLLGRSGRGRMFLPGILTSSDVSLEGALNSGDVATYQTAMELFVNFVANGYPAQDPDPSPVVPVLLHSTSDDNEPTPLTGVQVQAKVGVLKQRLR